MNVLIVDDHPIVHETLGAVTRAALPGADVDIRTDLAAALARARELGKELRLVLLDLGLPGYTGIRALTEFRDALPGVRLAVVSATEDSVTVGAAMRAGAVGYIPKTSPTPDMVEALKLIVAGGVYVPRQAIHDLPVAGGKGPMDLGLTDRQTEVLRLLMKGLSNRAIGERVGISENTVKQHIYAIFRILDVHTRTEALIAIARRGIQLD